MKNSKILFLIVLTLVFNLFFGNSCIKSVYAIITTNGNGGSTDVGVWFNVLCSTYGNPTEGDHRYNTWSVIKSNYLPYVEGTYKQYDADNPDIVDEQLENLADAEIDFLLFGLSNSGFCEEWLPNNIWTVNIAKNICPRIKLWNDSNNWKVKYTIAIGTWFCADDADIIDAIIAQATEVKDDFVDNPSFGGSDYYYQVNGKPLLVVFDYAHDVETVWENYTGDKSFINNNFTLRYANDGEPGQYGWYTKNGTQLNNEVEVVQPGYNVHLGAAEITRSQGDYYMKSWDTVLDNTLPRIVLINSFNDWAEDTAVWKADTTTITYENSRIPEEWTGHDGKVYPSMYWDYTVAYISSLRHNTPRPVAKTTVLDSGFEAPEMTLEAPANHQANPSPCEWTFSETGAGIQENGSAYGAPDAPEGDQTAFVNNTGKIYQSVYFPVSGNYTVSFKAAARQNYTGQEFNLCIDDTCVGTFKPIDYSTFTDYTTSAIYVTSGYHTIKFAGLGEGSKTCFIDNVSIAVSPTVLDSGFETPEMTPEAPANHQANPSPCGWTFSEVGAGIQENGSSYGAPDAPEGDQTAFINNTGEIYQSVYFPSTTFYTINFKAAARQHYTGESFDIFIDEMKVGSFEPIETGRFIFYKTDNVFVKKGTHDVKFIGTGSGGSGCFIDDITITPSTVDRYIQNQGFERVEVDGYAYNPKYNTWAFRGASGIQENGSAFLAPEAPEGTQTAFISNTGIILQNNIYFHETTYYSICFKAAARLYYTGETFDVYIDSTNIGSFAPTTTDSFTMYITDKTLISKGAHSIKFAGTGTGSATCFIDDISIIASPVFCDSGFEAPEMTAEPPDNYQANPVPCDWTFSEIGAGIQENGSAYGAPNSPEGDQTAFINNTGYFQQEINFPATNIYRIMFQAAARLNYMGESFEVFIDEIKIGTYTPTITSSFTSYTTDVIQVMKGFHTVKFIGTSTGSCFIDEIQ